MTMDPLTLLARLPPGSALFVREQLPTGSWEIAWLIREESTRLAQLGPGPEIEFRAGVLEEESVVLVPVLVCVGPPARESVYETWINQYDEEGGVLETLADQRRLAVRLYGDDCQHVCTLAISNQLQPFARHALGRIAALADPWTMPQFDRARDMVYRRYPSVWDLWQALAPLPSPTDQPEAQK
jgi:hypothetical protein